jgi:hypothetical protein
MGVPPAGFEPADGACLSRVHYLNRPWRAARCAAPWWPAVWSPLSHSGPARRVEDRQIVVDARTGKLVAGDKRSGYGMTLDDVEAILNAGPPS